MVLVDFAMSNDEIADRLIISKATAKTHVSRIMGSWSPARAVSPVPFDGDDRVSEICFEGKDVLPFATSSPVPTNFGRWLEADGGQEMK